jgi:hypothetical protein
MRAPSAIRERASVGEWRGARKARVTSREQCEFRPIDRVLSGKQPPLGPLDPPPVTQQLEQLWGEHREAVLAALALLDTQKHALTQLPTAALARAV